MAAGAVSDFSEDTKAQLAARFASAAGVAATDVVITITSGSVTITVDVLTSDSRPASAVISALGSTMASPAALTAFLGPLGVRVEAIAAPLTATTKPILRISPPPSPPHTPPTAPPVLPPRAPDIVNFIFVRRAPIVYPSTAAALIALVLAAKAFARYRRYVKRSRMRIANEKAAQEAKEAAEAARQAADEAVEEALTAAIAIYEEHEALLEAERLAAEQAVARKHALQVQQAKLAQDAADAALVALIDVVISDLFDEMERQEAAQKAAEEWEQMLAKAAKEVEERRRIQEEARRKAEEEAREEARIQAMADEFAHAAMRNHRTVPALTQSETRNGVGDAKKELAQLRALQQTILGVKPRSMPVKAPIARRSPSPVLSSRPRSERATNLSSRLTELGSDQRRARRRANAQSQDAGVDAKMDSRPSRADRLAKIEDALLTTPSTHDLFVQQV